MRDRKEKNSKKVNEGKIPGGVQMRRESVIAVIQGMLICGLMSGCCSLGGEECDCDGTAEITFRNRSSHSTYDVIWDGSNIGSLGAPGTGNSTLTKTVKEGDHTLHFMFSNGSPACSESSPVIIKCENHEFSCSSG